MKTFILISALLIISVDSFAQQWVQVPGIPDGAGITDIVVTLDETIIVSTASFSSVAGTLGGVRRSTDGGATWQNPLEGFNGRTLHLGDAETIFASFWPYPIEEGLYRSTNDGVNWTRLHYVNTGDNIFSITSKNNNDMIFIGTRNGVQRSTNAGVSWSYVNTGIPANSWVRDIEIDTSNGIVIAATTNGVFTTTNDGVSWEIATGISPQDTIVKIAFDYGLESDNSNGKNKVYYGSSDGSMYTSFVQSRYLVCTLVAIFAEEEVSGITIGILRDLNKKMYGVSTFHEMGDLNKNGGFYFSWDGETFHQQNNGLPPDIRPSGVTSIIKSILDADYEVSFYLGSFGNAIDGAKVYRLTYLVGIQQISSEIPSGFSLQQNYPNPFNPSTKINFDIPGNTRGIIRLAVYDITGREIAMVVNKELSPGSYVYDFDGSNLASGVYYYTLQANGFIETKKMSLVK